MSPWTTCSRCDGPLYPYLARATGDGWVHVTCPRTCGDCGVELGRRATSGYCRHCYDKHRKRVTGRSRPVGVPVVHDSRPCLRCSLPTRAEVRVCRDCRDVLADMGETDRWVAA